MIGHEEKPFVSIVIPAWNEERYIAKCLQSLTRLAYPRSRLEIIVVDNGSDDETVKIAKEYCAQVYVKPNGNVGAVRNFGVSQSKGDILAFIDSDCEANSEWLLTAISNLRDHTVGAVGGACFVPERSTWVESDWFGRIDDERREIVHLACSSLIMRREDFLSVGQFNEKLSAAEDDELSARLRKLDKKLISDPGCSVVHHGYPKTLIETFKRELWHGSNLLSAAGSWTDKTLIAVHLFLFAVLILFLSLILHVFAGETYGVLLFSGVMVIALPVIFAVSKNTKNRSPDRSFVKIFRMTLIGFAYLAARAVGLLKNYNHIIIENTRLFTSRSLHQEFLKNILLPLVYFIRKEPVSQVYDEILVLEKASSEHARNYCENKKKLMFKYLVKHVDFYKPLSHLCFEKLPVVDKCLIRNQSVQFMNLSEHSSSRSTSGTTGEPFCFEKDHVASAYMDAMMFRAYEWHGVRVGDRQARIWGAALSRKSRFLQTVKDYLLNRRRLSAFHITDDTCHCYYEKLLKFQATHFYAYVNGLYQFAITVEKMKLDGRALNIEVAICTGEMLFDYQRGKIGQVFGCKVVNEYGCTENGIIAMECEYGSMHVLPTVSIEVLEGNGETEGELLVTELNSKSVAFARYKNGDRGRLRTADCECNRPYPLLDITQGREDSYIVCVDGAKVYDAVLAYILKDYASKFRAIQEKSGQLEIEMVLLEAVSESRLKEVHQQLHLQLGASMQINIKLVEEITPEKSGKMRYFISRLSS